MGVDEMGYKLWYSGLRRIEIVDRGKKKQEILVGSSNDGFERV